MNYRFAVIGAGPAGIASVGQLLDHGILAKDILWIDPEFAVGDFGTLWRNVPSNTTVKLFLKFLYACKSFLYTECKESFRLNNEDPNQTCELNLMAEPLLWITNHLKNKVHTVTDFVEHLSFKNNIWCMTSKKNHTLFAQNIILAMGSEPKTLSFTHPIIPLQDAMDRERIKKYCHEDDTIAVFGGSHSAILVLRNLQSIPLKKIINFYRSPLLYAIYKNDDEILFDNIGLKGTTADWAHRYLEGSLPDNLERVFANSENMERFLPECSKVIYAIGFDSRRQPVIEGIQQLVLNEQGKIAPHLFGIGIAFPEKTINHIGQVEERVGLWKFMDYLQKVMPAWIASSAGISSEMETHPFYTANVQPHNL